MAKTKDSKAVLDVQAQIRQELAGLKDRVEPPSGFMISTKGKVFTLPDGSSNPGPMKCIILDWVSANTYFEGLYNPKDIKPPTCFAIGRVPAEMAPSDRSPSKQHDSCKGCPKNEFGSDPQGGAGKACKNTRRLLIIRPDADEDTQAWVISVSPTGLKHFDKYINTLADQELHPIQLITEIEFEASEAYPSLRFKVVDKLPQELQDLAWMLKERNQEILLQEPKLDT